MMRLVEFQDIKEGMVLARDILDHDGTILVNEGMSISGNLLRKLDRMNIEFVFIKDQDDQPIKEVHRGRSFDLKQADNEVITLNNKYNATLETYKSIVKQATLGEEIPISHVESSVTELLAEVKFDNNILETMRNIQIKDEYTYKHSVDVAMISAIIGKWYGFNERKIEMLGMAGLLHDLGKMQIPDSILNKKGPLTDQEYEIMKNHSRLSYDIARKIEGIPADILDGILDHHEKYNGTGYPMGKKGTEISIYGRILAVADIFSAMITDRIYKKGLSSYQVAEHLNKLMFDHLDPEVTTKFLVNLSKFYVGNRVLLSNGEEGVVVLVNKHDFNRPLVKTESNFYDLSTNFDLNIVDVL